MTTELLAALQGSIPSPSFDTIPFWPRELSLYGLIIAFGIMAAAWLARPRTVARNMHPDTVFELLMWVVPAGLVGARMYHVVTDWKPISDWHKVWEGGLGIPGAILFGAIAALLFVRRHNLDRNRLLDAVVPGVPLAQAIGRWGNYVNQELYGKPSTLPWAVEIDDAHRPRADTGFANNETFHPTFLYESLWNLALVGLLLWLDRRQVLKSGKLIWVYTGLYAIGRLWIEALRIDTATEILGIRVNLWTMSFVLLVSLFMLRNARRDGSEIDGVASQPVKAHTTADNDNTTDRKRSNDDTGSDTKTKKSAAGRQTTAKTNKKSAPLAVSDEEE